MLRENCGSLSSLFSKLLSPQLHILLGSPVDADVTSQVDKRCHIFQGLVDYVDQF